MDSITLITLNEDEQAVLAGFCEAMCFTESDYSDDNPDDTSWRSQGCCMDDFVDDSRENMARVVIGFMTIAPYPARLEYEKSGLSCVEMGRDLWYTMQGHGTGFWDRGLRKCVADSLSKAAKTFERAFYPYRGDDGQLHYE